MKDKLHWTWKKITFLILTICGIGTLTACYGSLPPYDEAYYPEGREPPAEQAGETSPEQTKEESASQAAQ